MADDDSIENEGLAPVHETPPHFERCKERILQAHAVLDLIQSNDDGAAGNSVWAAMGLLEHALEALERLRPPRASPAG